MGPPMRKKYYFIISIVLACIFGFISMSNMSTFIHNPFVRNVEFKSPLFAAGDIRGNMYVIDNSTMRIVKVDSSGTEIFSLEGGSREQSKFYSAIELAVDENENLYILNNILDDNGQYVEVEQILKYDAGGKFSGTIYSVEYKEKERPIRTGNLCSLSVDKDNIYCYIKSGNHFTLNKFSGISNGIESIKEIEFTDAGSMIIDFAASKDMKTVYFTTKKGEIYKCDGTGLPARIYSGSEHLSPEKTVVSIPWEIELGENGLPYFTDLLQRKILEIDAVGHITTVMSGQTLKQEGYDNSNGIFYRLSVSGAGTISTVSNEYVISGGADKVSFFSSGYSMKTWSFISRILIWLQLILFALLIAYIFKYIYSNFIKLKISSVFLQSIFIIFAIAISTVIVSNMIFSSFGDRYEKEVFNRISQTLYLTAENIDGDVLEKIQKPEDFMGDNYKAVREQLHNPFNNNEDSWNAGFYGALYTVKEGTPYVIMYYDDSKCPYFPMYEDGSEQDYIKAFNEGRMITTKSSDVEGDWMYGVAPVYNSQKKVVGVLEIGTDLFGFKADNDALMKNVLLETLTLLVVLVFVLIEVTISIDVFGKRRKNKLLSPAPNKVTSADTLMVRPLCFIIYAACFISGSFIPLYMKKLYEPIFGLPENLILALPISAEALSLAIASVIGGYIIDKKGWKITFTIGLTAILAGQVLSGTAETALLFIAARAISGAGMGMTFISLQNYMILPDSEEEKNQGISALNSGGFAGVNSGIIVGGMLAERLGYSRVFLYSAALIAVCLVIALRLTRNVIPEQEAAGAKKGGIRSLLSFFTNFRVLSFFILILLPVIICTMFLDYYFPIFAEGMQVSPSGISRALLLNGLCIIYIGPFLSRYIPKYIGAKWSMILAGGIVAGGLLQFAFLGTMTSALITIVMIGVGESFGIATRINYFTAEDAVINLGQGKALGYYGLVENLGQVVGPITYSVAIGLGAVKGIGVLGIGVMALIAVYSLVTVKFKNKLLHQELNM